MSVTAAMVKELRERTGLGMMECKKALVAADADIELAIENLRKSGQAKAAKKAGRVASEGRLAIATSGNKAVMVEVNCETDFVGKDDNFVAFANTVAQAALDNNTTDVEAIKAISVDGATIEESRLAIVQKLGENIQIRRAVAIEAATQVSSYVHGVKIGVLVALEGGNDELGKDVAMHVAAANPMVNSADDIPAATLAKEEEIFTAQAAASGKPPEIIEKMIVGRINKFKKEVSLQDQPFIKNPDVTVGKLAKEAGATIQSFVRLEMGEGIEKEEVDFAAEVAATIKG